MESNLTPEQFLKNNGIELQKTQLLSFIDGCMRSPNLCALMEQYHKEKEAVCKEKEKLKKHQEFIIKNTAMQELFEKFGHLLPNIENEYVEKEQEQLKHLQNQIDWYKKVAESLSPF